MFVTVLHQLTDPKNIAMIIRSHVAFGGNKIIFLGYDEPYKFTRKHRSISRSLERYCEFIHLKDQNEFFEWAEKNNFHTIAAEITDKAINLPLFQFPDNVALIMGPESGGLEDEFINKCSSVVKIPQFGYIGSMNVAISASIIMYEISRGRTDLKPVIGKMYDYTNNKSD